MSAAASIRDFCNSPEPFLSFSASKNPDAKQTAPPALMLFSFPTISIVAIRFTPIKVASIL